MHRRFFGYTESAKKPMQRIPIEQVSGQQSKDNSDYDRKREFPILAPGIAIQNVPEELDSPGDGSPYDGKDQSLNYTVKGTRFGI